MTIEKETPLMTIVIAVRVVDEWMDFLDRFDMQIATTVWAEHEQVEEYLYQRAQFHYENHKVFRRALRQSGDKGRDALYAFMYHWMTSHMIKSFPQLRGNVPSTINGTTGTV